MPRGKESSSVRTSSTSSARKSHTGALIGASTADNSTKDGIMHSRSLASLDPSVIARGKDPLDLIAEHKLIEQKAEALTLKASRRYNKGHYADALKLCEEIYELDAYRTDNLLLLGAIHFQLRNFSESIFYSQQCIRVDPGFGEAYSNLGNALKELGDLPAAVQFYMKAIKLKPRYADAYNNLATAHMQLGQIDEAKETLRMALVLDPKLVDAHNNLGNLHKAIGDLETAKHCYLEAIRVRPQFAIAWNNLAGVFKTEQELETAVAYFKEAIRLCPEFADAHSNLGNALKDQGMFAEAIDAYDAAVRLRPDFAIAHGNRGACLYAMGDLGGAIRALKYALQLEPDYPDARNNLASSLFDLGKVDDCILELRAALRLKPDHPHVYNNLGNAMRSKGFIKEAIHCYVTAIRLMPTLTAAHNNLGALLKEQGKVDQAMAHFQEALRIDPRFADAFCNMGNGYREFGCHEDAIRCYEEAIRIDPCSGEALSNLGGVLREQGRLLEAVANYKRAVDAQPGFIDGFAGLVITNMMLCEWSTRKEDFAKLIDSVKSQVTIALRASRSSEAIKSGGSFEPSKSGTQLDSHSSSFSVHSGDEAFLSQNPETPSGDENLYKKDNLVVSRVGVDLMPSIEPFISLLLPFSLLELQQIAQRYAAKAEMRVCLVEARKTFKPRAKVDKIRIGYVSSDFGNHPVGQLMVPVFKMQNRKRFEVFCYATTRSDGSQWRSEIEQSCDRFKDISGLSAIEACRFIRNDFIHILIDLNGHTKNARTDVFALRPCSVQMQFMGFPGTMGASFIDYLVADPFVIPEQYREYYSEKLLYLPHTCFVNNHKHAYRDLADERMKTSRQRFGISEDKFVFCNFSQLHKLSPEIFDVWMRILKRVPNSILWLLRLPAAAEQNILEEALKRGIRADRFHFSEVVPKHEHLLRCFIADLALDTPMSGFHSAACDLLWAGTPFVSIPGERMTSRISSSILQASGLGDLICNSLVEYEELAVSLALDAEKLHLIRSRLEHAKDTCASFDTERMIRNLDIGLEKIWERVESGLPPDHTFVPDAGAVYKPLGNAIQFDAKREFLYNSTQGAVCEPASPDNRSYHSVDSYSTTTNNQTYSADSRANKSATGSASSASYKEDFDEGSLLSLDR